MQDDNIEKNKHNASNDNNEINEKLSNLLSDMVLNLLEMEKLNKQKNDSNNDGVADKHDFKAIDEEATDNVKVIVEEDKDESDNLDDSDDDELESKKDSKDNKEDDSDDEDDSEDGTVSKQYNYDTCQPIDFNGDKIDKDNKDDKNNLNDSHNEDQQPDNNQYTGTNNSLKFFKDPISNNNGTNNQAHKTEANDESTNEPIPF